MAEGMQETHRAPVEAAAGGSALETIGGAGAVVLAIVGLAEVLPYAMAAVATIIVAAALMFEGASTTARLSRILHETRAEGTETAEMAGGMTAEFLGGAAGIVLGVLALIGLVPTVLIPVAAIVFGGSLVVGGAATARINSIALTSTDSRVLHAARMGVELSSGAELLVGTASVVLGILGVVGVNPLVLGLVALLSVGVAVLLNGGTVATKMMATLSRRHTAI